MFSLHGEAHVPAPRVDPRTDSKDHASPSPISNRSVCEECYIREPLNHEDFEGCNYGVGQAGALHIGGIIRRNLKLPVNKWIVVSHSPFNAAGRRKAKEVNIDTLTIEEAFKTDWATIIAVGITAVGFQAAWVSEGQAAWDKTTR